MTTFDTIATGISFPEVPRWHDGRLWFADMETRLIHTLGDDGTLETVRHLPGGPSGMAWADDGALLVVSQHDRRLMRLAGDELSELADLSAYGHGPINDMVRDERGRCWIGEFGFDFGEPTVLACLMRVDPDGTTAKVAEDLHFPNGCGLLPGGVLVVAETFGHRLSAFDVHEDGTLSERRTWAQFAPKPSGSMEEALESGSITPDGMCLDAEGCAWVADIAGRQAVRVREGGEVLERIAAPGDLTIIAVGLGGEDGRTLFGCAGTPLQRHTPGVADGRGRIVAARVDVGAQPAA